MSGDQCIGQFLAISCLYLQQGGHLPAQALDDELIALLEAVNAADEPGLCLDRMSG